MQTIGDNIDSGGGEAERAYDQIFASGGTLHERDFVRRGVEKRANKCLLWFCDPPC
jgi:hypothetical protein